MSTREDRPVKKVRRRSTPLEAQQLWDAVSYWTSETLRQQATAERINTFLRTRYGLSPEQGAAMLQRCLEDRLLVKDVRTAARGKNSGSEVVAYAVPDKMERDGWDWYCFDCHKCKGAVTGCVSCFRVYHPDCLPAGRPDATADFKCPHCQELEAELAGSSYDKETLNKCFGFVCERVKFFVPENMFVREVPAAKGQKGAPAEDEPFREALLLFEAASVARMAAKCAAGQYRSISELVGDARAVLHNAHVFHADAGGAPAGLTQMLRALEHDADEIKNCVQCFVNSNEQPKDWYCLPCQPPHLLVYAKQKGYCYWPAKVIKKSSDGKRVKYDVRFFGPPYERANIEAAFIKPIDTPAARLSLKRSAKLDTALRELATHNKLLEAMGGAAAPKEAPPKAPKPPPGASPPKKRLKTATAAAAAAASASSAASARRSRVAEDKAEPELPVEGKADAPPELDANRNSVSSSDNRNLAMEESSEDAVSSSNAANGEGSGGGAECAEAVRQKLQAELAKQTAAHAEEVARLQEEHRQELERIRQQHKLQIEETKAKIWCCQCFGEAILYCCWQTAYCSKECQHRHWMSEHKLKCRRSR